MNVKITTLAWLGAAIAAGVMTLVFVFTPLDLIVASYFYDPVGPATWPVGSQMPWKFFNDEDDVLVIILAGIILTLLVAGLIKRRLRPLAVYAAFALVAVLVGPILVVNGIFKGMEIGDFYIGWARPRPRQIIDFGGDERFYHLWEPAFMDGLRGTNSSFASGHVSIGAIFIVIFFMFNNVDLIAKVINKTSTAAINSIKAVKYGGLISSIVFSFMLSVGRISAGAHFASDCMYAVIFVWTATAAIYYWVFRIPRLERRVLEKAA